MRRNLPYQTDVMEYSQVFDHPFCTMTTLVFSWCGRKFSIVKSPLSKNEKTYISIWSSSQFVVGSTDRKKYVVKHRKYENTYILPYWKKHVQKHRNYHIISYECVAGLEEYHEPPESGRYIFWDRSVSFLKANCLILWKLGNSKNIIMRATQIFFEELRIKNSR